MGIKTCPYFRGSTAESTKGAVYAVYCRRPSGAVRVPSRDERQRFCATDHHRHCAGSRPAAVGQMLAAAHP